MTKQRFVIGEFISVTMNEPMLFCFVIGEFISVTMNEPMLFCFVIDEFCSKHCRQHSLPSSRGAIQSYALRCTKSKTSQ